MNLSAGSALRDDRRDSYRLGVQADDAWVDVASGGPGIRLRDLSASGGGLEVATHAVSKLRDSPVIRLATEPGFAARFSPVRSIGGNRDTILVGARFETLSPESLSSLSRFMAQRFAEGARFRPHPNHDQISIRNINRERVQRLLGFYLLEQGAPLQVFDEEVPLNLLLRARALEVRAGRAVIVTQVAMGSARVLEQGREYVFTFPTGGALARIESAVWHRTASEVLLTLPPEVQQRGFRGSLRARPRGSDLWVTLFHPRLAGMRLEKPVVDVSHDGLSFQFDPETDALFAGESVREVNICGNGLDVVAEACIRMVAFGSGPDEFIAGMQLLGFSGTAEREQWQRFVFHCVHPRLRLGNRESVEQAWQVLETSRYIDETTPKLLETFRKHYHRHWLASSKNPGVSRFIVQYDGERPVGTVAASLLYPHSWMAHQFGIDKAARKIGRRRLFDLARELFGGMQHLSRNFTSMRHLVVFADAKRSWNRMIYEDFATRYTGGGGLLYDFYSVHRCVIDGGLNLPGSLPKGWTIIGPDRSLLRRFYDHLLVTLPTIEREAYGWQRDDLLLSEFSRRCATQAYQRQRDLFFLLQGGEPIAVLVAELGEVGVNIFGLLNRCWIVPLTATAAGEGRVHLHLLARAFLHYKAHDKPEFVFFAEPQGEPKDPLQTLGIRHVADGFRFIARRDTISAWMSHVQELMEMLKS